MRLFLVVQIQDLGQVFDPVLVGLRHGPMLDQILFLGLQSLVALLRQRAQLGQADGRRLLVVLVPEALVRIPSFDQRRRLPRPRGLVLQIGQSMESRILV